MSLRKSSPKQWAREAAAALLAVGENFISCTRPTSGALQLARSLARLRAIGPPRLGRKNSSAHGDMLAANWAPRDAPSEPAEGRDNFCANSFVCLVRPAGRPARWPTGRLAGRPLARLATRRPAAKLH